MVRDYKEALVFDRYLGLFNNFLTCGKQTSTYKAVFLRALTDIGKYEEVRLVGGNWIGHRDAKTVLGLDFIAVRFIKYYWDMDVSFALRHLYNRSRGGKKMDRDAIVTLIEDEIKKMQKSQNETDSDMHKRPPTLEHLASEHMSHLRAKVIKQILERYVIKAILTDMKGLFQKVGDGYIEFDSTLIEFMKRHSIIIKNALNYVIAKKLEKSNSEARHIAIKIDQELTFEKRLSIIDGFYTKSRASEIP